MTVFEKGLITIVSCAVLLALLAIPLMLRKVPRNVVYGFRTRATLGDDRLWYEANAHFGRGLLIASIVSALAILTLYHGQYFSPPTFLKVSIAVLILPTAIATAATARHIHMLKTGGS
jgi:uncharacterized membrane protein